MLVEPIVFRKKFMKIHIDPRIEHVSDDLYLIDRNAITFADNGFDLNSNQLKFGNPRYFFQDGKMAARGLLNDSEMNLLRETIRTQGLKNPPQLRIINKNNQTFFEIVDGERRIRSVLKLINEKAEVYDPVNQKYVPAIEKYSKIIVRIEEMDEKTAISRAFCSNDRSVAIGEAATVMMVKKLRICNVSDEEICKITGLSMSWLRETEKLISLDDVTFMALSSEKINRTLALKLSDLHGEDRLEKLSGLLDAAQLRLEKIQQALQVQKEHVENRIEMAEAEIVEAEHRGGDVEKPKNKKAKAEKRLDEIKDEVEKLGQDGPKANIKDWEGVKPLTSVKIKKYWVSKLEILMEGVDNEIDMDDVVLAKALCEGIETGEQDIVNILKNHKASKQEA